MSWLRTVVAVFAMLHGAAHLTWFVGAWIPRTGLIGPQPWLFSPRVTITSGLGRLAGLLALAVAGGFVTAGTGLLTAAAWWPAAMLGAAARSTIVVLPWWRASFPPSLNATLAIIGLVLVTSSRPSAASPSCPDPAVCERPRSPAGDRPGIVGPTALAAPGTTQDPEGCPWPWEVGTNVPWETTQRGADRRW
jgi:hypothetical protein